MLHWGYCKMTLLQHPPCASTPKVLSGGALRQCLFRTDLIVHPVGS